MASSLEDLIAAQRASANAATNQAVLEQNQSLESGLGDLQTEQDTINPQYDQLIRQTNQNYQNTLGSTRSAAAGRGAYYGSGGLTNQELKLGAQNAQQVSDFGAERTRKLADIARRRSLLKKQANDNISSLRSKGAADLESTIAELRYKEYQADKDYQRQLALKSAPTYGDLHSGSNLSPTQQAAWNLADNQSTLKAVQDLANSGLSWGDAAAYVDKKYGAGTATKYDLAFKAVYGAKDRKREDFFMSPSERSLFNSTYKPTPYVKAEE